MSCVAVLLMVSVLSSEIVQVSATHTHTPAPPKKVRHEWMLCLQAPAPCTKAHAHTLCPDS